MDWKKEYFACLALRYIPKLGVTRSKPILEAYPTVFDAVQDARSWPMRGLSEPEDANACLDEVWRPQAEEEYRKATQAGMEAVTWNDPRYPEKLRTLIDPPILLYVRGDMTLLANPAVAVVGARKCTDIGRDAAFDISRQLSSIGITVVSGLAIGIDREAHLGGLQGIGSSIGVLGTGMDMAYPPDNLDLRERLEAEGAVVTEFPPGTPPSPNNFPMRNRIISGLSLGVLVAEAAHKSGSLITARLAMEQGREVFALPGPISLPTFTGCIRLIKQGAALVESGEDIVQALRYEFANELAHIPDPHPLPVVERPSERDREALLPLSGSYGKKGEAKARRRPSVVERKQLVLSDEEQAVMSLLDGRDRLHIDQLGRELEWDSSHVSRVLLMLEMRGVISQLPGMWYLAKEGKE